MLKIFGKKFTTRVKKARKSDKAKTWFESFVTLFWNLIIQPLRAFAPILGFTLGIIKIVLLFFGFVFSVLAIAGTIVFNSIFSGDVPVASLSKDISPNSAIEIKLDDHLMSASVNSMQEALITGERFGFLNALEAIRRAEQDPRIKGIYLRMDNASMGIAELQELRRALKRFRKAKKWVLTYADSFHLGTSGSTLRYYLASVSDEIWMHHLGDFAPMGLMFQVPLAKGTMEKIKVKPHFIAKREYKTYPEMFTNSELSPQAREVMKEQMSTFTRMIVTGISKGRMLSIVDANRVIEDSPMSDKDALKAGYIDKLVYEDEIEGLLRTRYDVTNIVRIKDYFSLMDLPDDIKGVGKTVKTTIKKKKKVVFVELKGAISEDDDEAQVRGITPKAVRHFLKQARKKGADLVVLHIDSPGGNPLPSEKIYRQIMNFKKEIPVVALLSNAAASGGYWIATAADKIIASPTSITGSIGVFLGKFELSGLWTYLGVNWGTVNSHENASALSANEGFSPQALQKLDSYAENLYDRFVDRVAESRNLDVSFVEAVARGRAWLGADAKRHKLIDSTGGYMGALRTSAKMLKTDLTEIQAETVSRPISLSALIRGSIGVYAQKLLSAKTGVSFRADNIPQVN